jgi:hypothetical protein
MMKPIEVRTAELSTSISADATAAEDLQRRIVLELLESP